MLCCVVPKALLPEGNGRDVYPRVQVNGRAVCLSARCVLVCCCTAGTSALSHLVGAALPTPVHGHTGSSGPTAPCVLCCTISSLCAVPHCLVLCTALHCACPVALHLWAVGSGQWNFCYALPHCLGAVGSATPAMHCLNACRQWAVELLLCTATLAGGSGRWNSCNALPHCLGAVGSGTPATHCLTAQGKWAVQLLQCTASMPGGSGQWNSCHRLPYCPRVRGQWNSCNALPHRLGVAGSGILAMCGPTSWGDRESCPGGCSCLKSGSPVMRCHTAWGQWAVQILHCTASLPGGSGQWNSCDAPPHCAGAMGSATPAMHCLTAWGQ